MAKNPPTVQMRRLGAQLRKLREARGLTLDEAADLLKLSKSALNRMENAKVITRAYEVEYFLMKYEVTDQDEHDALLGLVGAGRSTEWIRRHGVPLGAAGDFVRLEQDSSAIRGFEPIVVPGLLQTPGYARAVMGSVQLDPALDLDQGVAFRMARQEVITRPDPIRLDVVIGEGAIRQLLGGAEVMRAQLAHLVEASRMPNVTLRVLPFTAQRHPGRDGGFALLDVEAGSFSVVVVESLDRSAFMDGDADVERYSLVFEHLCDECLSETESRALVEQVLGELEAALGEEAP